MAAPSRGDEFLDLVRKSGVVEEKRLDAYLQKMRATNALPDELGKLAGVLVRDGILTHFQAEQFLQGKWKRFTIGKYKVLERLGQGGMGSVYLCEHKFMRRRVAVKVLPAAKADDPAALERFYREARAVAALDHPNIVRAYDIDQDEKLHFLVMEYVDGSSLQEIVKKHGPMDITRAVHYLSQAAIGLQHAHQTAGLVHRDIKPGNVLVDRNGVVKVLDMGLARFFNDEEDILTKKYDENVLGTADYLAPEQALDSHSVDIRADIYSLGATFYFMLTGNTPFTEGSVAQKLIWHQTRQPKPVKSFRQDVPEPILAILDRMMAKDPAKRYQTPSEVMDALRPWTQQPIPPPPEKEMPRLSPAAMGSSSSDSSLIIAPSQSAPGSTPQPAPPKPRTVAHPTSPAAPPRPAAAAAAPQPRPAAAGAAVQPRPAPQTARTPAQIATPSPSSTAPIVNGQTGAAAQRPPAQSTATRPAPQPAAAPSGPVDWGNVTEGQSAQVKPASTTKAPQFLSNFDYKELIQHRWFWPGVASVAGLLVLVAIVYFATRGNKSKGPAKASARTLVIARAMDGEDVFPTFKAALGAANSGDTIEVRVNVVEEQVELADRRLSKLTIQSGLDSDKKVVWKFPESGVDGGPLLAVRDTEWVHLKGFTFEANGRSDIALTISGSCPGLTLEDVELKGFRRSAIAFFDCRGTHNAPLVLRRIRTIGEAREGKMPAHALCFLTRIPNSTNQNVAVVDSRFEGPYKSSVLVDSSLGDVEFRHNRFFRAEEAFFFEGRAPRHAIRVRIDGNTFSSIHNAALFFGFPQFGQPQNSIHVHNNLFHRVGKLAEVGDHREIPPSTPITPARWITLPKNLSEVKPVPSTAFFRTTFPLPDWKSTTRVTLDVGSPDQNISLVLNKTVVPFTTGDSDKIAFLELPAAALAENNVLAMTLSRPSKSNAAMCCLIRLTIETSAGQKTIVSDAAWKCVVSPPLGWDNPALDVNAWPQALVLEKPPRELAWQSSIMNEIRKASRPALTSTGNVRDPNVREGNCPLDPRVEATFELPEDPSRADFLIYSRESPLFKGPDHSPGVPPS